MYLYETHLHTLESSQCGFTPAQKYIPYYKDLGYSGIFITDHFFNGNTCISKTDSWETQVFNFCKPYEKAKDFATPYNVSVFFGWESNFSGDEFLVYGLDKAWLLKHPEIMHCTRTEHYDLIHSYGGLVVQAHPFRERDYLDTIYLNPDNCDAMEAYNASNSVEQNHSAEKYCCDHHIFMTAGSDMHKIGSLSPCEHYGMHFDFPIESEKDYVQAILSKKGSMAVPPSDRKIISSINTKLPVIINHRE